MKTTPGGADPMLLGGLHLLLLTFVRTTVAIAADWSEIQEEGENLGYFC